MFSNDCFGSDFFFFSSDILPGVWWLPRRWGNITIHLRIHDRVARLLTFIFIHLDVFFFSVEKVIYFFCNNLMQQTIGFIYIEQWSCGHLHPLLDSDISVPFSVFSLKWCTGYSVTNTWLNYNLWMSNISFCLGTGEGKKCSFCFLKGSEHSIKFVDVW